MFLGITLKPTWLKSYVNVSAVIDIVLMCLLCGMLDYVFCEVHRLPEQHECSYDHKEHGRKEAREKMVSPKKHVGTTLKRLDSDA